MPQLSTPLRELKLPCKGKQAAFDFFKLYKADIATFQPVNHISSVSKQFLLCAKKKQLQTLQKVHTFALLQYPHQQMLMLIESNRSLNQMS
jgi:hypothetical protein